MAPCPRWVSGTRSHHDEVEVELHQQGPVQVVSQLCDKPLMRK